MWYSAVAPAGSALPAVVAYAVLADGSVASSWPGGGADYAVDYNWVGYSGGADSSPSKIYSDKASGESPAG